VLKPLSRALADGDPVYCVIRGSAVNNDGASNGLTAPNPQAQEEVLRDAYERAGVEPLRVGYVEAHGTGTPLGDPIEARALAAVLCEERPADRPLLLGSVKSNIGHLEGAAGIAGVIKLALALRHREIPPSLHFVNPNPHIPFEELRLRVATAAQPWPASEGPRVGGVSSFGWGGTNCHIVMEESPVGDSLRLGVRPFPLGGGGLEQGGGQEGGGHLGENGLLSAIEPAPLLTSPLLQPPPPRGEGPDASRDPGSSRPSPTAFLFGPQGGQWPGMGCDLLAEPAFRAAVARCDRAFRPLLGWSVLEEIAAGAAGRLAEALDAGEIVEPLLFTVQVALAALWRSRGIEPDVVIGHSLGEMAAAHVAGALSLEDAALVVVEYQRAQRRANEIVLKRGGGEPGGMALVNLSPEALAPRLAPYADRVVIAGYNSPVTTGLSGDPAALDAILAPLKAEGVFASRIAADAAVHSPQMEPALDGLRQALAGIRPRLPRIALFSTVTGAPVDGPLDGDYWCRNLRQPVRFVEALTWLFDRGTRLLVEIDPHPVLAIPVEQTLAAGGNAPAVRNLPSMRRGEPGLAVLKAAEAVLRSEGRAPSSRGDRFELFPLSGRTSEALRDAARLTAARLREPEAAPLADLAYTAALRRSHHEHRLALTARTREELADRLDAFARGEAVAGAAKGRAGRQDRDDRPRLVFAFSGQGPQWAGMGRQLFAEEPVYRAAVERCDDLLRPHLGFSVLERLAAEESALEHTEVAQPVLFALQVGLTELWRSRGVEPDAVVGHSVGEIAAAWAAGVFPLDEAARIVALRGRTMQPAQGRGKMAAVELPEAEAAAALAGYEDRVCVAAVNSPAASVLAGEPAALEAVLDRLRGQGVTCRMLRVEYAFHSPQMEPYDAELERALAGLAPREARIPFASTVLPGLAVGPELDAAYWRGNVRRPVRFADAVEALGQEGFSTFVEIGPHPVLAVAIAQTLESREPTVRASLRRNLDERETTLEAFGGLYTLGHPVDWNGLFLDAGRTVSLGGLPSYPFQRQRYWFEPGEAAAPGLAVQPALSAPAVAATPVFAAEPSSDPGVEQVLAGQIDAFTRLVTLQLDLLRGGAEDFPRDGG
jgi:acyl transferase domain-containing protein